MISLSSPTPDATTTTKGKVQLANNLGGTAALPTVTGVQAGVIVNASLATATGAPGGSWNSYSPTLTNITIGNGTSAGAYIQIGKTILWRWTFTFGSTSAMGTGPTITLPVAPTGMLANVGYTKGSILDTSAPSLFDTSAVFVSSSTILIKVINATLTYGQLDTITSTVPMTWATGDLIQIGSTYEAA